MKLLLREVDVNRLAQRFYEASGLGGRLLMTDKPMLVAGLRGVFEELGIDILEEHVIDVDMSGLNGDAL